MVIAVREQREKKKEKSHKKPDTNQLDFCINWSNYNKGEQTEKWIKKMEKSEKFW